MAITINGSGTITGISTGGIPDGVVDTDVLADNAVTFGKIGTTEQGQLCKAWVNFDGTLVTNPGSATGIRASYNVSSITDNGTGNYYVNLSTAVADLNFSVSTTAGEVDRIATNTFAFNTASRVDVRTTNLTGTYTDVSSIHVAIFR
jgi:hypothetical protein